MDFTAVSAFVHAAEHRSFTEAANKLGLTASGVSKAISRLEEDLGVTLLRRTTRSISLTADGTIFFERCKQILADLEDARLAVSETTPEPHGKLNVTMPVVFGRLLIIPRLVGLLDRYPSLAVDASLTDRVVDLVEEGIDAAIRIGDIPDGRMVARRISTTKMVVCASAEYFHKAGRPKTVEELNRFACVAYRYPGSGRLMPWKIGDRLSSPFLPTGRFHLDNGDSLVDAALGHAGIVYLQDYMAAPHVASGRLETIFDGMTTEEFGVYAVYPQNRRLSQNVRALVDYLVEAFSSD
ncbi:LysR family transcriptional regulator [Caballeronia sp. 15715]|jgi:LysR family transcriptional regulator, regulator for bpeEF and oprC|uniref:LysR family transcriptional regulator n=1 Tax=unclassified Caballeronia TaxID=2646786 RepID=UPI0039E63E7B